MTLQLEEISRDEIHALAERFEHANLEEILRWAWDKFGTRAGIGTSFQGAGLVMIDHALKAGLRFPIFTLDTQLLFPETVQLQKRLEDYFGVEIESIYPEQTPEQQAAEYGPKLWSVKPDLCCTLRKVMPLQKKLEQLAVWITGLRRQQSETRKKTEILELYHFDVLRDHYILKLNPMANWKREDVWNYIRENKFLTIRCTTAATGASAACPARAPRRAARMSAPAAGPGSRRPSAAFTLSWETIFDDDDDRPCTDCHHQRPPRRAGEPEHLYFPGGVPLLQKNLHALVDGEGLECIDLAREQGIPRPCPLPRAAHRHDLRVSPRCSNSVNGQRTNTASTSS